MVDHAGHLGRVPSPPSPKDWPIRALLATPNIVLPTQHVDHILGRSYRARFDQQENSCVGHSTALAKIVEERRDLRRTVHVDPVEIWRESKANDGLPNPTDDRGTYIRTALDLLRASAPVTASGQPLWMPRMRIAAYYRISTLDEAKAALVALGPIVVGATWFNSWFTPGADGTLPDPDAEVGGHAFVLYGYSDRRSAFSAANSWGTDWGLDGDFWVPYRFWGNEVDEAWKLVDAVDIPA